MLTNLIKFNTHPNIMYYMNNADSIARQEIIFKSNKSEIKRFRIRSESMFYKCLWTKKYKNILNFAFPRNSWLQFLELHNIIKLWFFKMVSIIHIEKKELGLFTGRIRIFSRVDPDSSFFLSGVKSGQFLPGSATHYGTVQKKNCNNTICTFLR